SGVNLAERRQQESDVFSAAGQGKGPEVEPTFFTPFPVEERAAVGRDVLRDLEFPAREELLLPRGREVLSEEMRGARLPERRVDDGPPAGQPEAGDLGARLRPVGRLGPELGADGPDVVGPDPRPGPIEESPPPVGS